MEEEGFEELAVLELLTLYYDFLINTVNDTNEPDTHPDEENELVVFKGKVVRN